jgi:hypothetical protein
LPVPDVDDVPPVAVTVTSTVPADARAGATAVICVTEFTTYDTAFTPPNCTPDAPDTASNPVPEITTDVPDVNGPPAGTTPDTTGAAQYVKSFAAPDVDDEPPGVDTTTSTVPAEPAGATTDNDDALNTLTDVPATPPNVTDVNPDTKFDPDTVTVVPANPDFDGDNPVTDGAA